jgi:cytochrome b
MTRLTSYSVWDRGVRVFHWLNLLCIFGLIAVGVAILNDKALGISDAGKVVLKTVHVCIGYVFVLNLLWRLVWAFIGGPYARWRAFLPGGRKYLSELRNYIAAARAGHTRQYLGHNPLGRISVAALLLLLLVMAGTGLVLAGTDLFYPPFGRWIAGWVAAPGIDPATLAPYAPEMYDAGAYAAMRDFRAPIVLVHLYGFYTFLGLVIIHILAVVVTELRSGGNLISAMVSGTKILRETPVDRQPVD